LAAVLVLSNGAAAQTAPAPTAQASEHDKQARALFEQGRDAYGDGRYREAWSLFHQAYQLSGRPELLFNIGQTADRLGQDGDALRAFDMYLQRLPNAPNRRDVENRVHALQERVSASGQPAPEVAPPSSAASPKPSAFNPTTEPASKPNPEPPAPPPPRSKGPSRQGFYLRGALGIGFRHDSISGNGGALDASINGFGVSLDLAAGYAIYPGLVLGGALFFDGAGGPTLHSGDTKTKLGAVNMTTIAAFLDWYLQTPSQGLHLEGALGFSTLSLRDAAADGSNADPAGITAIVGGGYEWPLNGDVAFGVLGRLTLALLSKDTDSHTYLTPSVLATLTWF
jgi:hypothetical protein